MNTLEVAKRQDYETCCKIINEGRNFQREQGFVQWDETYPTPEMISNDIDILNDIAFSALEGLEYPEN